VLRGHETGLSVRFTAKIIFSRNGAEARKNGANDFFGVEGVQTGVFSLNINKMSFFIRLSISEGPN
jgi:hypothetical protein